MLRFVLFIILSCLISSAHALPSFSVGMKWEEIDHHGRTERLPFLAQSLDGGNTWASKDIPDLNERYRAWFLTADCGDVICVAAGESSYYPKRITIVQTTNGGDTWNNVTVNNLDPADKDILFKAASCDGAVCAVLGVVYNDDYNKMPRKYIVMRTADNGQTWSSINLSDAKTGYEDVSCFGNYCVAVGGNYLGRAMLESFDAGLTWTPVVLDASITTKYFDSIHCGANGCTALGWNSNSKQSFATIVQSSPDTNEWTQVNTLPTNRWSKLNSIHCDESGCIAVGRLDTDSGKQYWIAQSDQNKNWTFETIAPNIDQVEPGLYSVDCMASHCMAIGNAYKKNVAQYVVFSNQSGSWLPMELPAKAQSMALGPLNCNDDFCIMAGETNEAPALLQTNNNGKWRIVPIENAPKKARFYEAVNP